METGDLVEDFAAADQHGVETSLTALLEQGPLVLYFYPKAMTPG